MIITNGYLDIWDKGNNNIEVVLKANGNCIQFFPKEKSVIDINQATLLGRVLNCSGNEMTLNMIGDRNPKTDQLTERKAIIKVGEGYNDIIDSKALLKCQLKSEDNDGKSRMVVEALYDKILIF